jgi:hypothetical protein
LSAIWIRSKYGLARILVDDNGVRHGEASQRLKRRSEGIHDLNERNGLDNLSNERRCGRSYAISRLFVCGLFVYGGHTSSILEIRSLVGVGLVVAGSGARDGVMRILRMQMLAVAMCVSMFVCGMSVGVRAATGLKE